LREIYDGQGIDVPDRILDQGVAALEAKRFEYAPTPPSFQRTLAGLWITRARWAPATGIVVGLAVAAFVGWQALVVGPESRRLAALPIALAAERDRVVAATTLPEPRATADRLVAEGRAALAAGKPEDAQARLAQLNALQAQLASEYRVRIVSRPGDPSGVWRIPAGNQRARNFYLIVEAIDRNGQPSPVSITSEEDSTTARVSTWGQRVTEAEFDRVRRDKAADGVIDQPIVGEKRPGMLAPEYTIRTSGGAILKW